MSSRTKKYGKDAAVSAKITSGKPTSATFGSDVSWETDAFGKLRHADESAEAKLESAAEDGRAVILPPLREIALNHINSRNYQEQLLIRKDIVAFWKIIPTLEKN